MAGIRVYHPTARSGVFTFEHNQRPYPVPLLCAMCQRAHKVKTYHLTVDHDGFAIVSPDIWALMQKHKTAGFRMANEVAKPPDLVVGFADGYVPTATPLEEN